MRSFLLALQFLIIVPIRVRGDVTEEQMLRSALAFPVVGFLIGLLLIVTDVLLSQVFPSALVSALVLLVLVVITGALHLDGLSDTFDALACRGDRKRRLSAMRDSSAGPIGMVAVMFSLGIKYLAFEEVASLGYFAHYAALAFMPVVGRWAQVTGMFLGKPSRPDGLGKIFIGQVGVGMYLVATALALGLFAGSASLAGGYAPELWYVFGGVGFALVFAANLVFLRINKKHFGGESGDTLGTASEFSEILFLLWVVVWSRLFI